MASMICPFHIPLKTFFRKETGKGFYDWTFVVRPRNGVCNEKKFCLTHNSGTKVVQSKGFNLKKHTKMEEKGNEIDILGTK